MEEYQELSCFLAEQRSKFDDLRDSYRQKQKALTSIGPSQL